MPGAKRKTQQELNEAYAFVTSSDFQATVENLRDGLVKNGFERQETQDLIQVPEEPNPDDLFSLSSTVTFTAPELPEPEVIPAGLENKVEIAPEAGAITLKGNFTVKQVEALEAVFQTPAGKEAIRQAVARLRGAPARRQKTPSELGELFNVPLLALKQGELWEPFEETHLLQGDWRLLDYPSELTEAEFKKPERAAQGGRFYMRESSIKFEYFDNIEEQLALFDFQTDWSQVDLVDWLAKNIPDDSVLPDEMSAYLNSAVTALINSRGFTLAELNYAKFRLRAALEEKIETAKRMAMQKIHGTLISVPAQFTSDGRCSMTFKQGYYAYDWEYKGFTDLPKHFFPKIGNLQAVGEEFECAVFLATQLEGVKCWVRNVERKPNSFSLQTATDRFYPDFLCQMEDGCILAVEYKNTRDWDLPDNHEKRQLGELWERRSNGKNLFIMPKGKDWAAIREKISVKA